MMILHNLLNTNAFQMFSAVILINQMAMQVMSCLRVAILFLLTLILNTLYVSQNTVKNTGNTR